MKNFLTDQIKAAVQEALISGELDLLAIPELQALMKDYVNGVKCFNDIVRKSHERDGKPYTPSPITATIPITDRESRIALLSALQSGVLEVPGAWVEEAEEINRTNIFLEIMKEVANQKEDEEDENKNQ